MVEKKNFPALEVTSPLGTLYLLAPTAAELWPLVKINQRMEDKDEGYQRVLNEARVTKIQRYVDAGNLLPNSLLVTFETAEFDQAANTLSIPVKPDAGWVIDGQHRLVGAHKARLAIPLPTIAFVGLTQQQQIEMFITINREQKGVSSSLYLDLLKHLPAALASDAAKSRAADLARDLRTPIDSPFHQRIVSTTAPQPGQLSTTNVVRKLAPHIKPGGTLASYSESTRAQILINLYIAIERIFPELYGPPNYLFLKTIGFGAIMNALPDILRLAHQIDAHKLTPATFVEALKLIRDFDFTRWREMGTGTAAENAASAELIDYIRARLADPEV